jgi:hypothetical protein
MLAISATRFVTAFTRASTNPRHSAVFLRRVENNELHLLWKRSHWSEYYKRASSGSAFMAAEDDDGATTTIKSLESPWNLGGLKKEVPRLTVRCHKKIGKANQRLQKANQEVERLTGDPDATFEELEKCPNIEGLESDLVQLQTRLKKLNQLEVLLQDIKGNKNVVLPEHVAELATELEVQDEPPQQHARPAKKEKGPTKMDAFRLPYRRYYTANKTEIRVSQCILYYLWDNPSLFGMYVGDLSHVSLLLFVCIIGR